MTLEDSVRLFAGFMVLLRVFGVVLFCITVLAVIDGFRRFESDSIFDHAVLPC